MKTFLIALEMQRKKVEMEPPADESEIVIDQLWKNSKIDQIEREVEEKFAKNQIPE